MFSSLMTGDVSVMVTCIFGSIFEVIIMAESGMQHFTSYFSGVVAYNHLKKTYYTSNWESLHTLKPFFKC